MRHRSASCTPERTVLHELVSRRAQTLLAELRDAGKRWLPHTRPASGQPGAVSARQRLRPPPPERRLNVLGALPSLRLNAPAETLRWELSGRIRGAGEPPAAWG